MHPPENGWGPEFQFSRVFEQHYLGTSFTEPPFDTTVKQAVPG
jgi:hypothetical protein